MGDVQSWAAKQNPVDMTEVYKKQAKEMRDLIAELLDAAEMQDAWSRAEGSEERWIRLGVPVNLLDRLAAASETRRG